ncbi:MAG: transketolase [Cuniculiplasma sp.]
MEFSCSSVGHSKDLDNKTLFKIAQNARSLVIKMVYKAKSGHPGGSLSIIDILTDLYFNEMKVDPMNPNLPTRDRLIMSKGHASPALYSLLALRGFFPQELLMDFRQINSKLEGHVHRGVPGVESSTGSLGQGLGIGVGSALSAKIKKEDYKTYAILGDGEIQEGSVWESMMAASKYKLNNLVAILDKNGVQLDGFTKDIMPMGNILEKVKAFGWDAMEFNGHDFNEIRGAIKFAKGSMDKPVFLIANTVKGKGVSYMENNPKYHGSPPASDEEYEMALNEIGARIYE